MDNVYACRVIFDDFYEVVDMKISTNTELRAVILWRSSFSSNFKMFLLNKFT